MKCLSVVRRAGACLAVVFALALGACASGGMGAGAEGSTSLEVRNNLIPPTSLSVYAVPESGGRRLLGVVQPGSTRTLRFDPPGGSGQFRFAAETTEGRDIVSNPLSFSRGAAVTWDVNANLATVSTGG